MSARGFALPKMAPPGAFVDAPGVFQIQCARRQEAVPITRDYIRERMHELRAREFQKGAARDEMLEAPPLRKQRH